MKKRCKRYKPKDVKIPSFVLDVAPIEDEEFDKLDMHALVNLEAIRMGVAEAQNYINVGLVLQYGYELSKQQYKNDRAKWSEIGLYFIHAYSGLLGAYNQFKKGQNTYVTELLVTVYWAVYLIDQLSRERKRSELFSVYSAVKRREGMMPAVDGRGFIYDPEEADAPESRLLLKKPAVAFLNGLIRTGHLRYNDSLNRTEWYDPNRDTTIAITAPVFILLEKALNKELQKRFEPV